MPEDGPHPAAGRRHPDASPPAPRGPLLDIRLRWRAGQAALGLAVLLAVVALTRPLAPGGASPRFRLAFIVLLGLGVSAAALLASLRGRGAGEHLSFYALVVLALDGIGQLLAPSGWPVWPLMAVLVATVAVAESQALALGVATLASLLAVADTAAGGFVHWPGAVAASAGYAALVAAVSLALRGEKRRLSATLAELARLKYGIDHLEEAEQLAGREGREAAPASLRQASEDARRSRQVERDRELHDDLGRLVAVARASLAAHAVLYFAVDREREHAHLRAADGPFALIRDASLPLAQDPFAFVLDRRQPFYATDFPRLLFALPYYRGTVKVGSLLAVPVLTGDAVAGVLLADRLEVQSLTGRDPELLQAFAGLFGDAILRARAAQRREELEVEFKAAYDVSRKLAVMTLPAQVLRHLLRSAEDLVPFEAAAIAMMDDANTRYTLESAVGWAAAFEGREVGRIEKTWTAWVLANAEEAFLLDHLPTARDRMPVLVLDEGGARAESLLAVPLRARSRNLGALVLTGPRGAFTASAARVLGILANQAAATLSVIQLKERHRDLAEHDALTGLYNRRAFDDHLARAVAREDRQGGRFALLMLDIDHFKKLNDTYGHPAGDAALAGVARLLERLLRKGDLAARYGGEEFAAILPGSDEKGALGMAERVRQALESERLVFEGARLALTASFGAAVWPADGREAAALVGAADRALYAAKQAGRNRVTAASQLTVGAREP
ncbi:MAG TPA: sensor domain-containing diguanylate cyclase [Vicinamibacteria bacterium]|nr:sensor domain-containing diguanylate cyclase [Vicinamibacteria bacterium]